MKQINHDKEGLFLIIEIITAILSITYLQNKFNRIEKFLAENQKEENKEEIKAMNDNKIIKTEEELLIESNEILSDFSKLSEDYQRRILLVKFQLENIKKEKENNELKALIEKDSNNNSDNNKLNDLNDSIKENKEEVVFDNVIFPRIEHSIIEKIMNISKINNQRNLNYFARDAILSYNDNKKLTYKYNIEKPRRNVYIRLDKKSLTIYRSTAKAYRSRRLERILGTYLEKIDNERNQ